ncbi:dipeptidase [Sphingomicrobium nitratireducens]|uniref:dipeptidase n=1 Tax=Sphingomicrobium nitratireducens TaxID=2964666 RepID=UPI00223EC12C|nr:membrane dipeptidase [Sphingomicrobium nitratireducens]
MLDRRSFLAAGAAGIAMTAGPLSAAAPKKDWFRSAIVIDGLTGLSDPYNEGHARLTERAWKETREMGLTVFRTTVRPVGNDGASWEAFEESVDDVKAQISANPDRLTLVETVADIHAAKRDGKLGIIIGTQDTSMVGADLDRIPKMHELGTRTIQLTYNLRNLAGDGALEEADGGLSRLGYATIEAIEANKMLLDLSHGGQKTMAQGAAHAKLPMVSHSGAMAVHAHPRHVDDATIRAIAEKGGTVGVFFIPYLSADPVPTGETLLRHIEHIAKVGGEDCVTIGTDNGTLPIVLTEEQRAQFRANQKERIERGIAAPGEGEDFLPLVPDYNSIDLYKRLGEDLMKRGWSQRQVEKLLGLNLLRVYGQAWG